MIPLQYYYQYRSGVDTLQYIAILLLSLLNKPYSSIVIHSDLYFYISIYAVQLKHKKYK